MKLVITIFIFAITLCSGVAFADDSAVSIYQLQYTTAADGKSPCHGKYVNCLGGVVTGKILRSVPRIIIQDPIIRNADIQGDNCHWGAIQIKDWTFRDLRDHVNIGDWIELTNVPIEDYRGTTFIQYAKAGTASSFSVISSGNVIPESLYLSIDDIQSPVEDPYEPGSYYVENHNAEKFESMRITVRNVSIVEKGLGKASDNYVLQSNESPNDPALSFWAADYMNLDAAGIYHPKVELGQHFCAIEGVFEQYTNLSDGFDYYQLLTTNTDSFAENLTGDLDGDCDVDLEDFGSLAAHWFISCPTDPNDCGGGDLVENGIVDEADLIEFTSHWLEGVK